MDDFSNEQRRRLLIFTVPSEAALISTVPADYESQSDVFTPASKKGVTGYYTCKHRIHFLLRGLLAFCGEKTQGSPVCVLCTHELASPTKELQWAHRRTLQREEGAWQAGHIRLPQGLGSRRAQLSARLCCVYTLNTQRERKLPRRWHANPSGKLKASSLLPTSEPVPFTFNR